MLQSTEAAEPRRELLRSLRTLQRRRARDSLIAYTEACYPGYRAARHHHEVAEHLEAVERGEIDRLMIIMPPRHGKSLLASQHFPAWYMGRNAKHQIIHASYGGELASGFGRYLRNLMNSPEHLAVFPDCSLATDSSAQNRWHTTQGGVYFAAGIGGGITGKGAHLALIDDPVKGREDAESDRMREIAWNWYQHELYSRLMTEFEDVDEDVGEDEEPENDIAAGAIVLIQTRWVEDDMAGMLLTEKARGGDEWTVLHHKAVSDEGKPLWARRFPVKRLARIRKAVGERVWSALYQGDPTPADGSYFKRSWIRYYGEGEEKQLPPRERLRTYGASDYATKYEAGDFTEHGVIGIDHPGNIYVLDWWRGKQETATWIERMLDMMDRWQTLIWAEEAGQIEKSVGPFLVKRMMERKVYGRREQFTSATDKASRARSIQGRFEMGNFRGEGYIFFPRHAPWVPYLISQLMKFPNATYDDGVDVLSLFGRMIAGMAPGTAEPPRLPDRIAGLEGVTMGTMWKDRARKRR